MKKLNLQFFILISIFLISCKNKEENTAIKTVYNIEEYMELWVKDRNIDNKIKAVDTFCINQTKRAKEDIKNGKLTYFMSEFECEFNGMKKLLSKHNIKVENYIHHCVIMGGFRRNCYQIEMWSEINKRFGEKYIDSLMKLAEKEFVINNPDSVYIRNGIDIRRKYSKILRK